MKKNTTVSPRLHLLHSRFLFIPLEQIPSKYSPIDLEAMDFYKGFIAFHVVQVICFRGLPLSNEETGSGFEGCLSVGSLFKTP